MRPRLAVEVRRAALAVALLPRLVLPGPEVVELVDAADARDQRRALGSSRRPNGAVVAQAARDPLQRGPFIRARREAHVVVVAEGVRGELERGARLAHRPQDHRPGHLEPPLGLRQNLLDRLGHLQVEMVS